jgi:pimeloyl-ACP methyl ester carboxylesterase
MAEPEAKHLTFSPAVEAHRRSGRTVRALGMNVFVVEQGSGDETPIVLLHGFPTSSYDFRHVMGPLAQKRPVVAFDFPGFGFSDKPAGYSYSLIEQADVVEVVLAEVGVKNVHLFAHDVGTSVATELLARRAAGLLHFGIESVVLMNGSVHTRMAHLTPAQKLLRRPILGRLFAHLARAGTFKLQMRRIFGERDAVPDEELDDLWSLMRHDDGHLRLPRAICYVDERLRYGRRWIGALETLDQPCLILWGARDPVAVIGIAEKLARETPTARLVRMEELGHYPQLEDPDRVVREIEVFLTAVSLADTAQSR